MSPDSSGKIKGIAVAHVPWHSLDEHDCLPNLLKCCRDANCLCDTQKCGKQHCEDCDKGGTKVGDDW